MPGVLI